MWTLFSSHYTRGEAVYGNASSHEWTPRWHMSRREWRIYSNHTLQSYDQRRMQSEDPMWSSVNNRRISTPLWNVKRGQPVTAILFWMIRSPIPDPIRSDGSSGFWALGYTCLISHKFGSLMEVWCHNPFSPVTGTVVNLMWTLFSSNYTRGEAVYGNAPSHEWTPRWHMSRREWRIYWNHTLPSYDQRRIQSEDPMWSSVNNRHISTPLWNVKTGQPVTAILFWMSRSPIRSPIQSNGSSDFVEFEVATAGPHTPTLCS